MRKIKKSGTLMKLNLIAIILGFVTLPGCEVLSKFSCPCEYDTPWTSNHAKYCYATKAQCEKETGESCYDCY